MTHTSTTQPNWPLLAGLRFGLAAIVLVAHMGMLWQHPLISFIESFDALAAVIAFLMVSGFSIRHSIQRQPHGFYWRRIRRIYPIYIVCLAIAISGRFLTHGSQIAHDTQFLYSSFSSLVFLQTFRTSALGNFMPSWTLGVEMLFYAVAPLLLKISARMAWALFAVSAAFYAWNPLHLSHATPGVPYIFSLLWAWLLGWIIAEEKSQWTWLVALSVPFFCLVFSGESVGALRYIPLLVTAICLLTSHKMPLSLIGQRVLARAGDLSYPLYLAHWPVITTFYRLGNHSPMVPLLVLFAICPLMVWFDERLKLDPERMRVLLRRINIAPHPQSQSVR